MVVFTLLENFKKHDADQAVDPVPNMEDLAAAQQKIEHKMDRIDAVKAYKPIVFYSLVIIWTMILWGYENQAGGMVLSVPTFRKDFGYAFEGEYVLPANWQSAITGGPTGVMGIGSVIGSYVIDRLGRRRTMLLASLISIPFITMEFIATRIEVFFAGKFMNAFCLGVLVACCPSFLSEISPLALRGINSAAVALALTIGPFVCVLINNTTSTYQSRMSYRAIFIPQWVFAAMSLLGQSFLPESPYWLISKGRDKDAMKQLKRMYTNDVDSQYALIKVTVQEAEEISSKSGSYIDAFRKKDLRRTLLVIFTFFMQAMCGVAYVSNYSTYYYQMSGFDTQTSFRIACGAQALSVTGVITSFFIIDRFGRRPLMLGAMSALSILNVLIAGTGLNKSNTAAMTTSSAFMAMYNFFYNVGIGPLPYVLGNEISSVFFRTKTIAMASLVNHAFQCMWGSVLPYMFNPDKANMGSSINFIFTGLSAISVVIFWFFLPEPAHRSFEEIDEMFMRKVPPRQWKRYRTEKQDKSDKVLPDAKVDVAHIDIKEKV